MADAAPGTGATSVDRDVEGSAAVPEGHTIHRLARDLRELSGHRVRVTSPQGRFADGASRLDGAWVREPVAWGKHLVVRTDKEHLHVHLGMRGKFLRYPDPSRPPLTQSRVRLSTSAVAWDLVAPSTCELLDDAGVERVVSALGPDPLRPDADREAAVRAILASARPIGAVLLDQTVVAGVGNVFRNEALHELGVNPATASRDLRRDTVERLWGVLQRMMVQAVEDGRIVTVNGPDRMSVPESESRHVYKQQRCRDCGAPVEVIAIGGRSAYVCPVHQPPP
jgi:formamidopyrimidine-DNA glycosylase